MAINAQRIRGIDDVHEVIRLVDEMNDVGFDLVEDDELKHYDLDGGSRWGPHHD